MGDAASAASADDWGMPIGIGAVVPQEASDAVEALALADSRLTGVADGEPMPRDSHSARVPARTGVLRPAC